MRPVPKTQTPQLAADSLDFSKAFDTLRHSTLLHKLAQLQLPDHLQLDERLFSNHSHCTMFDNQQFSLLDITASIIQGSAIGPAAYVVNAGDLATTVPGNSLCKFALQRPQTEATARCRTTTATRNHAQSQHEDAGRGNSE